MNTKVWIGDNKKLRKTILSMIDVEKYGGKIYFRNCSAIFFYQENSRLDVTVIKKDKLNNSFDYFKSHKNKEINILS